MDKPLRILLLTSVLPWPLRHNGGAQRTALLRDALARHGTVDLLLLAPALKEAPPDQAKLAEQNIVGYVERPDALPRKPWYLPGPLGSVSATVKKYAAQYEPDAPAMKRFDELMAANRYDLLVSRYLQPAMQTAIERYPNVPTLLDFDDIDWLTLKSQIAAKPWGGLTGKIAAKRTLDRMTELGQAGLSRFTKVFVTCEEDEMLLSRPVTVLPNIPFSGTAGQWLDALPPVHESRELLFVGDLQFPPNRDGLDRFLARVWPLVRASVADAALTIVGRGLSDVHRAKWSQSPGVNVIGFAADLQACYRSCAMTVVPIYFGGGTKIKVLESLAYGRTVVTTPEAMRGYAVLESENAVAVAPTDEAFAKQIARLLKDAAERDAMAQRGRATVEQFFSPARFTQIVDDTLKSLAL